jgi:hypothetical protein
VAQECQRAYLAGSPMIRRLLNAAFFEKLMVEDDRVRSELTAPYRILLGPEMRQAVESGREPKRRADLVPPPEPWLEIRT